MTDLFILKIIASTFLAVSVLDLISHVINRITELVLWHKEGDKAFGLDEGEHVEFIPMEWKNYPIHIVSFLLFCVAFMW